jgi:hypothetical protein
MRVVGSHIFGHDLKCEGVSSGSNLGRRSTNGRLGAGLLPWLGSAEAEHRGCHGRRCTPYRGNLINTPYTSRAQSAYDTLPCVAYAVHV